MFFFPFLSSSLFVSTWNVGGKTPHGNLNLDDWLHSAPPADIYVLGYEYDSDSDF